MHVKKSIVRTPTAPIWATDTCKIYRDDIGHLVKLFHSKSESLLETICIFVRLQSD